jgi:hypothetical protein
LRCNTFSDTSSQLQNFSDTENFYSHYRHCSKMKLRIQLVQWISFSILATQLHARINENLSRKISENEDDEINVFVRFKNETKTGGIFQKIFSRIKLRFATANVMSAVVRRSEFSSLQNDPDIDFIEEDFLVYPDAEVGLYGLKMIQATSRFSTVSINTANSTSACNNASSFKIGVSDIFQIFKHTLTDYLMLCHI